MKGKKFLIVFLLTLACTFGFTGCSFTGLSCGGVVDTPQNSTTLDSSQPNGHVHSWTETILQESECTKDGVAQYSCECGVQETRLIEATGHKYSETTVVKKPSCYSEGEDEKVCLTCGDEVKTVIQKTDHDYELIEATAVGLTYRCALCYDEKETQTAQDLMEQTQESYLFDVETDFSFTVKKEKRVPERAPPAERKNLRFGHICSFPMWYAPFWVKWNRMSRERSRLPRFFSLKRT